MSLCLVIVLLSNGRSYFFIYMSMLNYWPNYVLVFGNYVSGEWLDYVLVFGYCISGERPDYVLVFLVIVSLGNDRLMSL